jgi:putative membrane-bound dehydrogenase-like protein
MNGNRQQGAPVWTLLVSLVGIAGLSAGEREIPHNQDRPPGPPLNPQQAIARMRVADGFQVKLFAAEPELVNPVAMTFDDRGRVWVTESLEYPRASAGTGRDRVKILEDTDGDGRADSIKVFAEGLNIPSGIALGYGGVFVANAPDLVFLKDTDRDDKADTREVLLTGFGRTDTHELPSCLTWGPDGWLYGLNGVFNYSKVTQGGKSFEFTCALWRYHPRSKAFELFAEGTSNPWGLDYDARGSFFVSACVIDHLWHLVETGYYHRQAGPYPPFTWKGESIVDHRHQKAAYCGLCYYDADAYPEEYRGRLMMGNIHGNCINSDWLERRGASYRAVACPDFLTADDAWFMPVVQTVGPDGCLWILDWYDRYHCYQDANRDPAGIDRMKGRLYRVTYRDTPMEESFDLGTLGDEALLDLLGHPNVFYRRRARRLLIDRGAQSEPLQRIVLDPKVVKTARLEALWTLVSKGDLPQDFHRQLLKADDPDIRAWGVRAAQPDSEPEIRKLVLGLVRDAHPDVRLQAVVAARKLAPPDTRTALFLDSLVHGEHDSAELLPRIVWRNVEPLLTHHSHQVAQWLDQNSSSSRALPGEFLVRLVDRLTVERVERSPAIRLALEHAWQRGDVNLVGRCLAAVVQRAVDDELPRERLQPIHERFGPRLRARAIDAENDPGMLPVLALAVLLGDGEPISRALDVVAKPGRDHDASGRLLLLRALIQAAPNRVVESLGRMLHGGAHPDERFLVDAMTALRRLDSPEVGQHVVNVFGKLPPRFRPQALDLLTSRPAWSRQLIEAVKTEKIAAKELNVNQIRSMLSFADRQLSDAVRSVWGHVRMDRSPDRDQVIARMRLVLDAGRGDPAAGVKVFEKVCAQCHKLRGGGSDVGPDLAGVGRNSLEQLLSNLLDPNLVIGKDYQARIVAATDGRVVTGLLVEDSPERVVLKVAGGKLEIVPRSQIEVMRDSAVSLMPEDLEKQVSDQEFRDLVAFLRTAQ